MQSSTLPADRGFLVARQTGGNAAGRILQYILSFLMVALATVIDRKVEVLKDEAGMPLFFAAIMLSAWFGGWGPSLVTTILSAVATTYYFYNPPGTPAVGWDDAIRSIVFLMVAALISSLTSIRKKAEEALVESHAQLERRVEERTAQLRQSEERFRVLVEGVADYAIVMLDQRGIVASWNSGAQRIYGFVASEIIGKPFTRFYADEEQRRGDPAAQLGAAALNGRDEDEGWRRRKDGSRFWANVIVTSLSNERGSPRGFAQVTRDVTELRLLERQVLEVSEAEQRRFGHDLHDGLGQELTGLAFLAQNLQRHLEQSAPAAAHSAGRIHDLINRALEQTRKLAQGFSPVELGPEGLRDALRDLARRIESLFDLPCVFSSRGNARIEDDSAALHLYRIAQEAVNNAVRHASPAEIRIHLEGQLPGGPVILTVEDDGIGLPAQKDRRQGMGLRAMLYRARVIGASLDVHAGAKTGGTIVTCVYHNTASSPQPVSESHVQETSQRGNTRLDPDPRSTKNAAASLGREVAPPAGGRSSGRA